MFPEPAPNPASRTTPLWAVLALTFLCSIGSGVVYGGVFFLAESQYGFGQRDNFILALVFGLAYMPGAYFAGPMLRRLRGVGVTPRTVLMALMAFMGLLSFLPLIVGHLDTGSSRASWPIWVTIGLYSPLAGCMWPIVESFLAGGRSEQQLRAATGQFNVIWSSAVVATMLAMAFFIEHHALFIIASLGVVHLACIGIVARFDAVPAAHEHHDHHRPIVYRQLLTFLRMLLPVSFMFNSTLSPYMPTALRALGVAAVWKTPVTAIWYTARVLTFLAMERWHGWHGRWTVPILGSLLLLVSFAWLVLVPMFAPAALGLPLFIAGLAAFGVGVGIVYAAALYYAMEVGTSGIDAGGVHETLIGIGYTAGPIFGLAGLGAAGVHLVRGESATLVMLGLVVLAATGVGAFALVKAVGVARPGR
jgi:hypothetical protein